MAQMLESDKRFFLCPGELIHPLTWFKATSAMF
jgi:hypothetical protein